MARAKITERFVEAASLPKGGPPQVTVWDVQQTGFGLVIGTRTKMFIAQRRLAGRKVKVRIGCWGAVRQEDELVWTVALAKKRAAELLGQLAAGVDPGAEVRARRGAITLRQAMELHLDDMRKRGCSPRSTEALLSEVPRHLAPWMDVPIVDVTALDLNELHSRLSDRPYLANRVLAEFSACWGTADRLHELPGKNPASRVRRNRLAPKRQRVDDEALPAWYAAVRGLTPARRDLRMLVAFTGLRSADARSIRWDEVDWQRGALRRPSPKGGSSKAFELPMTSTVIDILRRRQRENQLDPDLRRLGGDGGFAFASLSRDRRRVQPIAEPKETRRGPDGKKKSIIVGLHALRRTYASVAVEANIAEVDRRTLLNHRYSDASVHDGYIQQSFPHLKACAEKIEALLWKKMRARGRKRAG